MTWWLLAAFFLGVLLGVSLTMATLIWMARKEDLVIHYEGNKTI